MHESQKPHQRENKMKLSMFTKIFGAIVFTMFAHVASAAMIFSATLNGDQQVPSISTSASGSAMAELSGTAGSYVLNYQIGYTGLSSPIINAAGGGHFHNAPAGSNGGVIHLFDTAAFAFLGTTSGTIIGDWRFDDASNPLTDVLADQLIQGNVYINLHTQNFGSGELRGQLARIPEPAVWLLMTAGLVLLVRRKNSQ